MSDLKEETIICVKSQRKRIPALENKEAQSRKDPVDKRERVHRSDRAGISQVVEVWDLASLCSSEGY